MTVTGLMMIAAAVLVAGLILELCAVLMAPRGYQDEHGFHLESQANDSRDSHS
jgi:predicted histidine transporter YuiF (NhaC family)